MILIKPSASEFTIALLGQSNVVSKTGDTLNVTETNGGSVYTLGNDDVYELASEPVDDATGEIANNGQSSSSTELPDSFPKQSAFLRMGNVLAPLLSKRINLIPCARGSSALTQAQDTYLHWENVGINRSSLFGNAVSRIRKLVRERNVAIDAVVWGHGEAQSIGANLPTFLAEETAFVNALRSEIGDVPFFVAQGGPHLANDARNQNMNQVQEYKRQLSNTISKYYIYPCHDADVTNGGDVHYTQPFQLVLGNRLAELIRYTVLGTGNGRVPKLVSIARISNTSIQCIFDVTLDITNMATDYWTVEYLGTQYTLGNGISAILRNTGNTSAVRINMTSPAPTITTDVSTLKVSYQRPFARGTAQVTDFVRSNSGGVPIPSFRNVAAF